MAFRCEKCGKSQLSGTKINKVIIETREVEYEPIRDKNDRIIKVPKGFEIVKEINVCPKCKENMKEE